MKNFGLIKTKIEDKLVQSYSKNSLKSELKTFKSLVLENRNALQLYHLYDSLSSPQGHSDDDSKLFLDEAITMINNLKKTVNLEKINEWVKDIKTENRYSDIDIVVEGKITKLNSIVTEHMNFCVGNAIKYLWRAGLKGEQVEDLRKARWYIDREIARILNGGKE